MRLISNSETTTWLYCQRKYYFEYVLDLEPQKFSDPISKGILIHSVLEMYYAAKALGQPEEYCRSEGLFPLTEALSKDDADLNEIMKIRNLMEAYWDFWQVDDAEKYEVYAVETKLKSDLSEDYALVGTIDLIWKEIETGRYYLVDHKSSYNFWTDDQAELSAQFPKYVVLGREHGLDIAGVIINQIRTRELKEGNELFRRSYVRPSEHKIADVLRQHVMASEKIMEFREDGDIKNLIPIFDKFHCASCSFKTLCDTYSNGGDIKYGIQQDFKKRTGYGYN